MHRISIETEDGQDLISYEADIAPSEGGTLYVRRFSGELEKYRVTGVAHHIQGGLLTGISLIVESA